MLEPQDNNSRFKTAVGFVIFSMVGYLAIAGIWLFLYNGFNQALSGNFDFSGAGMFLALAESMTAITVGQFVFYIVNGILFINWFQRSYNNLHLYRAPDLSQGRSMATWGWFIPFANWYIPSKVMASIWKGYNHLLVKINSPNANQNASVSPVQIWWGLWVAGSIISTIGSRTIDPERNIDGVPMSLLAIAVGTGLQALAGIFLINLMKKVREMESEVYEHKDQLMEEAREQRRVAMEKSKAHVAKVQAQAQMRARRR